MTGDQRQARELVHSFRQVYRVMNSLMRIQADALGVTPAQLLVLRALAEEPNLSLSELAERIELGCSTVSGVVQRLVDAEIVERERLDEDQRTLAIRLTVKGNELHSQAFGEDSLLSTAVLRFVELPQTDIQRLLTLHGELIQLLSTQE